MKKPGCTKQLVDDLLRRYPQLGCCMDSIWAGYGAMKSCFMGGGKLLIAGNGGSAADAGHIAGELMKSFRKKRPICEEFKKKLVSIDPVAGTSLAENLEGALPAIPLTENTALISACANDIGAEYAFAQQVLGYGKEGDVFLGLSTSGMSKNVVYAAITAKAIGMKTVALTGENGGELAKVSDVAVKVPETEAYLVQELHLPIYHCWCEMLEGHFFG